MLYSDKMVVFGKKWLYLGQSGCNRAKMVVFGQKWLYSDKGYCLRPKQLYSGGSFFFRAKAVAFVQNGCIRGNWLYWGRGRCVQAK